MNAFLESHWTLLLCYCNCMH